MELPLRCSCGETVMVDPEAMEIRPISKLYFMEFFVCEHCKHEEACFYTTPLFEESLRKLDKMDPFNKSFLYHFAKALKRSEQVQRKGTELHGKIGYKDVASSK